MTGRGSSTLFLRRGSGRGMRVRLFRDWSRRLRRGMRERGGSGRGLLRGLFIRRRRVWSRHMSQEEREIEHSFPESGYANCNMTGWKELCRLRPKHPQVPCSFSFSPPSVPSSPLLQAKLLYRTLPRVFDSTQPSRRRIRSWARRPSTDQRGSPTPLLALFYHVETPYACRAVPRGFLDLRKAHCAAHQGVVHSWL